MNVVRMNTAHASETGLRTIIRNVRSVSESIPILIDTKGPEVRTTACDAQIPFLTGEVVRIFGRPDEDTRHDVINVTYPNFARDVSVGCHILFDDGVLEMLVTAVEGDAVVAEVRNDGLLGSHKSVNVPGAHIALPAVTEKDRKNILLAISEGVDFVAHSFVRSAEDVKAVKSILDTYNSDIRIISKIENQEGVDNIDEIIEASYGIMIARGDLGIEVPIEKIPGIQRQIIRKCVQAKKPVIVATQMLHSMINNPRPTRAEVTDIANAIYYRTDALMLSGETASGKYPLEAVSTMSSIAEQAEKDKMRENDIPVPFTHNDDIREFMAHSAILSTEKVGVKCIIIDSTTGKTALNLAAFRGPHPVLAICYEPKLQRLLNLSYGIIPVHQKDFVARPDLFRSAVLELYHNGSVKIDDCIAWLSGNMADGGNSKSFEIHTVKEVLDR